MTATPRAILAVLAAAGPLSCAAVPARADMAPTRFRGTVESRDDERLTIRRPGGSTVTLRMNPKTRVLAVTGLSARDIKPESYLSVVGLPGQGGEGGERVGGVTLYSPSERGFEAGRQAWDEPPGATLTAGWVSNIDGEDDRRVTLAYAGGQSRFDLPRGTRVTQIAPGEKAQLVPGAAVSAFAHARPDGSLSADTVAVGRLGAVPGL